MVPGVENRGEDVGARASVQNPATFCAIFEPRGPREAGYEGKFLSEVLISSRVWAMLTTRSRFDSRNDNWEKSSCNGQHRPLKKFA